MKKVMKNSTATIILNSISGVLMIALAVFFVVNAYFNQKIVHSEEKRFALTHYANMFMDGSAYLTDEVRAYAVTGNQEHYNNYMNEVNVTKSREEGVNGMNENGITAEEQSLLNEMSSISNKLVPLETQAMEYVLAGDRAAAVEYVYGKDYEESIGQIAQLKSELLTHMEDRVGQEVARLNTICGAFNTIVWTIILLTLAMQILTNLYTSKKLLRPIVTIEKEMSVIAQGNLNSEFHLEADTSEIGMLIDAIHRTKKTLKQYIGDISDKLSQMAAGNVSLSVDMEYIGDFQPIQKAMNTILDALNHMLSEMIASSNQVTAGSEQVAQGAQNLAQGATEQASSVEELSATINDLSSRMNKVAQSAISARDLTDGVSGTIDVCNQKMTDLVKAMDEISDASSEIGKIIDTIEDIAFQTNILALNAAVEAARAGNAGKGFAVVAGEVRSLATQSQQASQSTAELIERALKAVKNGTQIVEDTAQTLVKVVEGAKESTSHVDAIATTSEEQALALQQLTEGVNQIATVVQSTSATSEESAAASEQLSGQAVTMQHLMSAFKLRQ